MRHLNWALASALAVAAGFLIVSGDQIRSGVQFVTGDVWDGRIMISLLEHWWNVVRGLENPLTPVYFHPFTTTLAYNDGNLISGLIYSVPRALGADPFLSYEITNWIIRGAGGLGMIALGRALGLGPLYAMAAAILFMISSNLVFRMSHAQLLFVGLAPWGLVLFGRTLQAFREESRLRCYLAAAAFAFFVWAWAMTAFYSLFGFGLILISFLLIGAMLKHELRADCQEALRRRPGAVAFTAVLLGVAVPAVLSVYRSAGHVHSVFEMRQHAGSWSDAVSLGAGGIWSKLIHGDVDPSALAVQHHSHGFTPVLLATFLGGMVWLSMNARSPRDKWVLCLGLAGLCVGLLAFRTAGFVHWEFFFRNIPGARAIRVPMRLLLTVTPIVILVAVFAASRLPPAMAAVLLAVIGAEQLTPYRPFHINRPSELAFLAAIPPKIGGCRAFFLSEVRFAQSGNRIIDSNYAGGVDAMLIAETRQIPTLGGMATIQPKGWDLLDPFEPTYRARVLSYADRMGIRDGLCSLDLKTMTWSLERP